MPASRASRADAKAWGRPSTRTEPPSATSTPDRIRISVDLPAPLSPTMPVRPGLNSTDTLSSATTWPYSLASPAAAPRTPSPGFGPGSQRGSRCALGSSSGRPHGPQAVAMAGEVLEQDGDHEDRAGGHFLPEGRDAKQQQPVVQGGQDEHAE